MGAFGGGSCDIIITFWGASTSPNGDGNAVSVKATFKRKKVLYSLGEMRGFIARSIWEGNVMKKVRDHR